MPLGQNAHFNISPVLENRIRLVLQNYNSGNDDECCGAEAFCRTIIPIAQDGPQCGLVSALMAANTILMSKEDNVDRLLELAKKKGYTNYGEMFSGI
uniref:Actin maturation protease n=1 Tax=Syphacia muris TaxID=451379 RepID=A0A0N5ATS2_9BILA